ncbi:MAG: MFS transporter [Defluviitaleaceae bacterium]|nr:MFS transporter [Defluviitaleaceae bacterium]
MTQEPKPITPSNRLPLFYAVTALFWFALYVYVPFVAPFGEEMGANLRMLGLIGGAYGFTQMVIRFPLGIISDRLGRRKIFVLLGLLFAAASGFVVFFFPSPNMLLVSRALGGVAASSWVTFIVLNSAYHPPGEATKSVGYLNGANAWGTMSALLLGGIIAHWVGVPYAFLLGGGAGLVALALGFGIREKRTAHTADASSAIHKKTPPPSVKELLGVAKNRFLLFAAMLAVLVQFVRFASTFGFTPLVAHGLGATPLQLGLLGVVAAAPGLVVSPLAGTVLPRVLGVRGTLAGGFVLSGVSVAVIPFTQHLWQLFVVQIVGSVGAIAAFTLLMGLCIRDITPERRATAMGFFQAVYGLGMFLGPFVMGWLGHSISLEAAFVTAGAVGLLGAALVFAQKY